MNAQVIFLPGPEVAEHHEDFRIRFDAWRLAPAAEREPQPAPRHFPVHLLEPCPTADPSQMALPLIGAARRTGNDKKGRRA